MRVKVIFFYYYESSSSSRSSNRAAYICGLPRIFKRCENFSHIFHLYRLHIVSDFSSLRTVRRRGPNYTYTVRSVSNAYKMRCHCLAPETSSAAAWSNPEICVTSQSSILISCQREDVRKGSKANFNPVVTTAKYFFEPNSAARAAIVFWHLERMTRKTGTRTCPLRNSHLQTMMPSNPFLTITQTAKLHTRVFYARQIF